MTETYAESETEAPRGDEKPQELRPHADGSQNAGRAGERTGAECLTPDRENRTEGVGAKNAIGGILDQLIEDTRKQLGKSRECVVWYQSEIKEFEDKLKNLVQLKELQQQQEADNEDQVNLDEDLLNLE